MIFDDGAREAENWRLFFVQCLLAQLFTAMQIAVKYEGDAGLFKLEKHRAGVACCVVESHSLAARLLPDSCGGTCHSISFEIPKLMEPSTPENEESTRLWQWFLGVTIMAVLVGWFGYRQYCVQAEERLVAGTWVEVDNNGNTVTMPSGSPVIITLHRQEFSVDPFAEPRRIDFYLSNGEVSEGIYCWENGKLRVLQSSEGLERPPSFTVGIAELKTKKTKGVRPDTHSMTPFTLQRVIK